MATEFKLPELGEGVDSAVVSRIIVSEGDTIEAEDNVMELETEKAVADLPCPHAGKIGKIHVSPGDTVEVGQTLLTIEEVEAEEQEASEQPPEEEADKGPKKKQEKKEPKERDQEKETEPKKTKGEQKKKPKPEQPKATTGDGKHRLPPPAGPATRRLARKLQIDLEELRPPEGGRITQEDVVQAYLESEKAGMLLGRAAPLPDFSRFGEVERQSLDQIARVSLKRLTASWRAIPHVTQHGHADITDLESARREYNERSEDSSAKITMTAIAVKSVVALLQEFPKFNASLDVDRAELLLKRFYHIGVAVDTEHGLLVPVIREADRKSMEDIAVELAKLANRARRHELQKEDMEGGTFTISNQGGIGGDEFTPIINYPEVAILGIARARVELRKIEGEVRERLILPLSLSYDHRVINGADAARFMEKLTHVMSDAFTMLVES